MFLTIRKAAKMNIAPENYIRRLVAQNRCPGVYSGSRFLVNVEALTEMLEFESRKCMEVVK